MAQITINDQRTALNEWMLLAFAKSNYFTSGMRVTGTKPFAAFSGNTCGHSLGTELCNYAVVSFTNFAYYKTHFFYHYLQTTLLPIAEWGTQFPLVPFMFANSSLFQIVASTHGTIVNASGVIYEIYDDNRKEILVDVASMLSSNYPVMLVQLGQVR